jgi:hypothetical protein
VGARIEIRSGAIEIAFPYDGDVVGAVHDIPGNKWSYRTRLWTCPVASLPKAIAALEPKGFPITKSLRKFAAEIDAKNRAKATARKQVEKKKALSDAKTQAAAAALEKFPGEKAFVVAGEAKLTRLLKAGNRYRSIESATDFGNTTIGYEVPESSLLEILGKLGSPIDPESRLLSTLKLLFELNVDAKRSPSSHTTSRTRYAKKDYLLREACRLATKQPMFVWGWKEDPKPPDNMACWVLYFQRDGKQLSFHTFQRGDGPDFPDEWDQNYNAAFPW